jgi:hypothetical protein
MNSSTNYSIKDIGSYFFDVKSNHRLKYHFFFGLNIAKNPFHFIIFFLCDLVRLFFHFFLRMRLKPIMKNDPKYSA